MTTMNHVQAAYGRTSALPDEKKRFGQIKDCEEWLEPCLGFQYVELADRRSQGSVIKFSLRTTLLHNGPFMNGYPSRCNEERIMQG